MKGRSAGSRGCDEGDRDEYQSPVGLERNLHQEEAAPLAVTDLISTGAPVDIQSPEVWKERERPEELRLTKD